MYATQELAQAHQIWDPTSITMHRSSFLQVALSCTTRATQSTPHAPNAHSGKGSIKGSIRAHKASENIEYAMKERMPKRTLTTRPVQEHT
eukprot:1158274-Pelagomonas_calceolata.AAC.25